MIKYLENKHQLNQMAVQINITHKYLTDGDSHHAVLFFLPYNVINESILYKPIHFHAFTSHHQCVQRCAFNLLNDLYILLKFYQFKKICIRLLLQKL